MTRYLLEMFAISLALTLLLELAIGFCFGYRSRKLLMLIFLVNVLTNPAAVLLHWLGIPQLPVELAVIFVEAMIYLWFSGDESWTLPKPVQYAVTANCISWGAGLLIQWIGG